MKNKIDTRTVDLVTEINLILDEVRLISSLSQCIPPNSSEMMNEDVWIQLGQLLENISHRFEGMVYFFAGEKVIACNPDNSRTAGEIKRLKVIYNDRETYQE